MPNQRPLLARLFEPLLNSRNEVARNVVADGAVFKLKPFLHLLSAFRQRLEATDDLSRVCVLRAALEDGKATSQRTFPYCP